MVSLPKPTPFKRNPYLVIEDDIYFEDDDLTQSYYRPSNGTLTTEAGSNEEISGKENERTQMEVFDEVSRQMNSGGTYIAPSKEKQRGCGPKTSVMALTIILIILTLICAAMGVIMVRLFSENQKLQEMFSQNCSCSLFPKGCITKGGHGQIG